MGALFSGLFSKPTPTVQKGRHDFLETPKYIEEEEVVAEAPKKIARSSGSSRRRRDPVNNKKPITLLGDEK
jgi:hypothetical protein